MPTAEDGWGWAGPQPAQGHLGHPIRSPWVGWSRQGSEEGGEPRDGCPDSIPMSNEQQMSHRLSGAVEIIKEHEKEYPEERNRFRLAEASWTPPDREADRAREAVWEHPWVVFTLEPPDATATVRPLPTHRPSRCCSGRWGG